IDHEPRELTPKQHDALQALAGQVVKLLELRKLAHEQQRANEFKTRFLANMSHEVRTPLNGVLGMSELLLDTKLDTEQLRIVNIIRASAENQLAILNDILDLSKVEAGKLELERRAFEIPLLLEQTLALFGGVAQHKGVELASSFEHGLVRTLYGDDNRIR